MAWIWEGDTRMDERVFCDWVGDTEEHCNEIGIVARQRALELPLHPAYSDSLWQHPSHGVRCPMPDRPLEFRVDYFDPPLRSLFGCCWGIAINNAARDALEALEPGVHQYLPMELTHKSGKAITDEFWMLNIGQRLDTCSPEHSPHMVEEFQEVRNPRMMLPNGDNVISRYTTGRPWHKGGPPIWRDLCLFAEKRAGRHLWYEYKMRSKFMSNELFEAWSGIGAVTYKDELMDNLHPVREI
ncbi:imm11 family protein [Altererythrobacter sp.]|uniref:imm11 family protein n=1 Tax=Altererythrobacter sp. TaxID=1872480 RepID=UPI003D082594